MIDFHSCCHWPSQTTWPNGLSERFCWISTKFISRKAFIFSFLLERKPRHVFTDAHLSWSSLDWLIDGSTDRWIDWLIDRWMDGLIDWLIDGWIGGLIGGWIDWLIDGLMDWLIDWLIDLVFEYIVNWCRGCNDLGNFISYDLIFFFHSLLPRKAIIATEDFLGVQEFMASFVGREGQRKINRDQGMDRDGRKITWNFPGRTRGFLWNANFHQALTERD